MVIAAALRGSHYDRWKISTVLFSFLFFLGLSIENDVSTVIGNAKNHRAQTWHQSSLSSVARYQPLQPEYVSAPYLSEVKGFENQKSAGLDVDVMVFK